MGSTIAHSFVPSRSGCKCKCASLLHGLLLPTNRACGGARAPIGNSAATNAPGETALMRRLELQRAARVARLVNPDASLPNLQTRGLSVSVGTGHHPTRFEVCGETCTELIVYNHVAVTTLDIPPVLV